MMNFTPEDKLRVLSKVVELNLDRNIRVAKRLLDYNENKKPIVFNYQRPGNNFTYVKFTLEGALELINWIRTTLSYAVETTVPVELFLNANENRIEYWRSLQCGSLQKTIAEAMQQTATELKLVFKYQSLKVRINIIE